MDSRCCAFQYQAQFETYVRHPSIVIYVLSNEMPYHGKSGQAVHEFLTKAYEHLSEWDHTRAYIGNAGGDYKGGRGRMYALEAKTGRILWEFFLVPKRDGEPADRAAGSASSAQPAPRRSFA